MSVNSNDQQCCRTWKRAPSNSILIAVNPGSIYLSFTYTSKHAVALVTFCTSWKPPCVRENTWNWSPGAWLISLNTMFSRPIHVFANNRSSIILIHRGIHCWWTPRGRPFVCYYECNKQDGGGISDILIPLFIFLGEKIRFIDLKSLFLSINLFAASKLSIHCISLIMVYFALFSFISKQF